MSHLNWSSKLMKYIDGEDAVWDTSVKRRVQHYGYRFDYATLYAA